MCIFSWKGGAIKTQVKDEGATAGDLREYHGACN